MNGTSDNKAQPVRKSMVFGLIFAALIAAVLYFAITSRKKSAETPPPATVSTEQNETKTAAALRPAATNTAVTTNHPGAPVKSAPISLASKSTHELAAELLEWSGWHGPISAEQAERYKQNLAELIKRGPASVPALKELMDKNVDSDFGRVPGGDQMGYSSMRASLIDAFKQIGGPEATAAMTDALQKAALPGEILQLAQGLDQQAPGQHRDEILAAARESLSLAASNQLGTNVDLQAAHRALQTYGGDNTPDEIAKNYPEKFANALALANEPDGQGLDDLIKMSQDPSGGAKNIATEMVAQMAGSNPQAMDTLLDWAQKGQIPNATLVQLAPILAGGQLQGGDGNGGGPTVVDTVKTPEQINQRLDLLNRLLGAVEPGSSAAHAINHEIENLNGRK